MADGLRSERKKYLYAEVVERIRGMIREGQIAVGDKLPPERSLAGRFGVSRNCVRQAVQTLAEQGILESRQGDGTYVRTPDQAELTESLAQTMLMQDGLLKEVWEFRMLMEPQIASLAAAHISKEEIDRLKVIVYDQQKKLNEREADPELDVAFHRVIVESSKNRVIEKMMRTVHEILNESRDELLQSHARNRASVIGHLKIIDALERNDPDAAYQAMRDHLSEVETIACKGGESTIPILPASRGEGEPETAL
jgi:GntR family transcriptional regulator, transcriptional repressor for pyruvate dehydrogenase complex